MKYETCDVESDYENGEKLAVALKLEFAYLESQELARKKCNSFPLGGAQN